MQIKKILCLLLCLTMFVGMLVGCGNQETPDPGSNTPPVGDTPEDSTPPEESVEPASVEKYEATAIQSQEPRYVPIAEVGTYNKDIVTDNLIANVDLPEAGNGKAPVWNGYILENKIAVNFENTDWQKYTPGEHYFNKFEIERMSELGFNCVRICYSLSYLSNPDDMYSINVSELEQLDELLSWCLENDLHLMISITGMPGKWNTSQQEEMVDRNPELFDNPDIGNAYAAYMEMLAMRYADIPSKALSFELLAEPNVSDESMERYVDFLAPVAQAMWTYDSSKILIVNDLFKRVPEKLAEIGCCLSLHNHFYPINSAWLMDFGVDVPTTYWPMVCVPEQQDEGQTTTVYSEEGLTDASVSLHYTYAFYEPTLYADGVLIPWENAADSYPVYDMGELHANIPDGTKELKIVVNEAMGINCITVEQGAQTARIFGLTASCFDDAVIDTTFHLTSEGAVVWADEQTKSLSSWQFMYDHSIAKFVECAEKNGVSYIMTEIGSDTQSLSVEDYIAYHTEALEVLKEHNIGWMYNCMHNILAPPDIMWQGQAQGFTVTPIEGTPYFENREITDMLVSFAQQSQ